MLICPPRDFYPRSPCGERRGHFAGVSAHCNFYPRSPCGERQRANSLAHAPPHISIHALLAESDQTADGLTNAPPQISIHALLAESDAKSLAQGRDILFLSTLSLRRATDPGANNQPGQQISIHALLAESDHAPSHNPCRRNNFYPRSPCGERRKLVKADASKHFISIHALLAESDALFPLLCNLLHHNFYPRSPCGERPLLYAMGYYRHCHFYPRSPCGERPRPPFWAFRTRWISIHALLAESDPDAMPLTTSPLPFLSTLSLRRATRRLLDTRIYFTISIHALLAESDSRHGLG